MLAIRCDPEDTPEFPPLMLDAIPKPFIVRTEISDTPIEVVQTSSDPEAIMVQTSRDYLFSVQVEITFHPDLVVETAISEATRLKIIIRMSGELPVLQEDLLAALSREVMKTRYRHPVQTCPDYQFLVGTHETSWGCNLVAEANAYIKTLIMQANGLVSTSTTYDAPQVRRGGRGGRGGRGVFRGETHTKRTYHPHRW